MKNIFFLLSLVSVPVCSFSQEVEDTRQTHFSIFGGVAIPTGDFGDNTITNDNAGLAKTGFSVGIEAEAKIDESFCIPVSAYYASNSFDDATIENYFRNTFGATVNIDAGSFSNIFLLSGIQFNGQSSPKMRLILSLQGGLLVSTLPELTVSAPGIAPSTQNSATGTACAYSIGAGFVINEKFKIEGRYNAGKPEFTITSSGSSVTAKQSITMMIISFGVIL